MSFGPFSCILGGTHVLVIMYTRRHTCAFFRLMLMVGRQAVADNPMNSVFIQSSVVMLSLVHVVVRIT